MWIEILISDRGWSIEEESFKACSPHGVCYNSTEWLLHFSTLHGNQMMSKFGVEQSAFFAMFQKMKEAISWEVYGIQAFFASHTELWFSFTILNKAFPHTILSTLNTRNTKESYT